MLNRGKCPKCESSINSVTVEDVSLDVFMVGPKWRGFSYSCQRCQAVLSIEMNPLTLKEDIAAEVVRLLRK